MKKNLVSSLFLSVTLAGFAQGTLINGGYVDYAGGATPVNFTLNFVQSPDFFTVDGFGRQADSFQFFIGTTLIRGEEIHIAGNIPIRNQTPPSGDPGSGGWGSVRGIVPYNLNGLVMTFSVPADVLSVNSQFSYQLLLLRYGASAGSYSGLSGGPIPVPEPSASLLGLLAFGWVLWRALRWSPCAGSNRQPAGSPDGPSLVKLQSVFPESFEFICAGDLLVGIPPKRRN